jgi:phage gpG-like protein
MAGSRNNINQITKLLRAKLRIAQQQMLTEASSKVIELTVQNFRQKSFFGTAWDANTLNTPLLIDSGDLWQSIDVLQRRPHSVRIGVKGTAAKYSYIHNYGGKFKPSKNQEDFFWAMYKKTKNEIYKNCALKVKKGGTITIPQRQFLGAHAKQNAAINRIIISNLKRMVI